MSRLVFSLLASAAFVSAAPLAALPDGPPDPPNDGIIGKVPPNVPSPGPPPQAGAPPGSPAPVGAPPGGPFLSGPTFGPGLGSAGPPNGQLGGPVPTAGPGIIASPPSSPPIIPAAGQPPGAPRPSPPLGLPPQGPPPGISPPGLPGQGPPGSPPDGHPPSGGSPCTDPRVRKEWHNLSNEEKKEYLRAVQCLYDSPGKGAGIIPSIRTRYDDFVTIHTNQTGAPDPAVGPLAVVGNGVHFNGIFLPWHRYLVWAYEETLINECDYKGAQPFWDWSHDMPEYGRRWEDSVIFDPEFGFGGNGQDGPVTVDNTTVQGLMGSCVTSGPFASWTQNVAPGYDQSQPKPHCLVRDLNSSLAEDSLQWTKNIMPVLEQPDYPSFFNSTNFPPPSVQSTFRVGIHGAGHRGVGGEMRNLWSSANDPLFIMHHAGLDWVWWLWQSLAEENLYAMGGPTKLNGTDTTTLDEPLYMASYVIEDAVTSEVMDTRNKDGQGRLCYIYEDIGKPLPPRRGGAAPGQAGRLPGPADGGDGKDQNFGKEGHPAEDGPPGYHGPQGPYGAPGAAMPDLPHLPLGPQGLFGANGPHKEDGSHGSDASYHQGAPEGPENNADGMPPQGYIPGQWR